MREKEEEERTSDSENVDRVADSVCVDGVGRSSDDVACRLLSAPSHTPTGSLGLTECVQDHAKNVGLDTTGDIWKKKQKKWGGEVSADRIRRFAPIRTCNFGDGRLEEEDAGRKVSWARTTGDRGCVPG